MPSDCPVCLSRKIHVIPVKVFDEWVEMGKIAQTYRELQEEKIWDYCVSVWSMYETISEGGRYDANQV